MSMRQLGRESGKRAALEAKKRGDWEYMKKHNHAWNSRLFPTLGPNFDWGKAVLEYDKKRVACTPDLNKFPELRGLADRVIGEREGFVDGTGFAAEDAAHYYSFGFFVWKHINAHHVARYDLNTPPKQCTNVFFPDTAEGGVVISDNRDDVPQPHYREPIPKYHIGAVKPNQTVNWVQGGVSAGVMLDDEPECIFPVSAHDLMPPECLNDIKQIVVFMTRYADFWGPGNQLWVDKQLRGVMVEKANVKVGYRWPTVRGAICITACSYIDPAMNAHKRERHLRVMRHKGETESTCPDIVYGDGCDKRQHRLLALTNAEAKRGATLWGALNVVADHAVPFPDRVCLAGEKGIPEKEPLANWSLTQHAIVVTGPNRRALYRSVQDFDKMRPVYEETPKLRLGEGVTMKPEWQADVDAGRCTLVTSD